MRRPFARLLERAIGLRAELGTAAAILTGWALLTWAVASLTAWQAWPVSGGLLLLSSAGWRLVWRVAVDGLYTLTREDTD